MLSASARRNHTNERAQAQAAGPLTAPRGSERRPSPTVEVSAGGIVYLLPMQLDIFGVLITATDY